MYNIKDTTPLHIDYCKQFCILIRNMFSMCGSFSWQTSGLRWHCGFRINP